MTKVQEYHRTMFMATSGVLGRHTTTVRGLPALEDGASRFDGKVVDINAKDTELMTMGVNKAQVKQAVRENLTAIMRE